MTKRGAAPWAPRGWMVAVAALASGGLLWITSAAAKGFNVLALEFAATRERAVTLLDGADLRAIEHSIYWDFALIAAYGVAIWLGCRWAAARFAGERSRAVASALAWAGAGAGVLDVAENLALLSMLDGSVGGGAAALATTMAIPKFLLILAAIGCVVAGLSARQRPRPAAG